MTTPGKPITLVFRCDDPSAISRTDLELRLLEDFRRLGVSCTFAIVPHVGQGDQLDRNVREFVPLPAEKAAAFAKAVADGTLEPALHGLTHQVFQNRRTTGEIAGRSEAEQRDMLTRGERMLRDALGAPVRVFIPPWNKYDQATLCVLADLGFRVVSADLAGPFSPDQPLAFVPALYSSYDCDLPGLRRVVEQAAEQGVEAAVVVLFHEYEFREVDSKRGTFGYDDFVAFVKWAAEHPKVRVCSMMQLAGEGELGAGRLRANQWLARNDWLVPGFVRRRRLPFLYYSRLAARRIRSAWLAWVWIWYPALFLAGTAAGGLAGWAVGRMPTAQHWPTWAALLVTVFLAVGSYMAAMRGTKLSLKRVSLAAACAGLFVGMASVVIRLGG